MNQKKIARIISVILSPPFLWPLTLIIFFRQRPIFSRSDLVIIGSVIFATVFVPFGYILYLFVKKKIGDLDLTKRKERIKPLAVIFLGAFISIVVATVYGDTASLKFLALILILLLANTAITLFWKISLHMAINIIFIMMINHWYANHFLILYFLVPLIFWSRLKLKKHTVWQLVAGIVLNAGILQLYFVAIRW